MDIFLQQIVNGLVLGSVYALIALGYTMVYGVLGLINFAHGDVLMVGALVALSSMKLAWIATANSSATMSTIGARTSVSSRRATTIAPVRHGCCCSMLLVTWSSSGRLAGWILAKWREGPPRRGGVGGTWAADAM